MILGKRSLILLGALLAAALVVSGVTLANRPDPVTLPEGTAVHVRLDNTVDSNQSRSGDEFDATVTEPVVVDTIDFCINNAIMVLGGEPPCPD